MAARPRPVRPEKPPNSESLSIFFRSLATMVAASVPLYGALHLLAKQKEDPAMARVAEEVARQVHQGMSMSRAMVSCQGVFSPLQLRMVALGERTGALEGVLAHLADYEEKRRRTGMKVRSALAYPAFMFVLASGMLVLLPPFMFGGIFEMIRSSGVEPPLITRAVMAFSDFVRSPWALLLALLVLPVLVIAVPHHLRRQDIRRHLDGWLLKVPAVGTAWRNAAVTRFSRAFALQVRAGEMVIPALAFAGTASMNTVLEDRMMGSVLALRNGASLVQSLRVADFFPRAYLDTIRAAEETGKLEETMTWMADVYERELDYSLDSFTALLEPAVMLGMGVIVGVVVTATMLPMIQVLQTL